jgi:type I restriction enzyme S subunit
MREVSLIDVCAIKNGYAFKSSEFKDSGTPLIRISSFNNGPVYFDNRTVYIDNEYLESKSAFKVEKGDVLIALSGATTGKYGLYTHDKPSLLNQRVGLLKSGESQDLDDKYFYFYLSVLQSEIFRKAGGAAQPNISTKDISEFKIPLPPLEQQKKIAAILDAADAYRQKTKALITKYEELTQSLFLDMFGDLLDSNDNLTTLEELCGKGKYGSGASAIEFIEGSPRYIRITDINQDGSLNDKVVSPDELDMQYLLGKNDIVFARTGATVGKTYLYDEKDGDLIYAGYLIKFKIPEPYNAKYFFHFTKTEKYKAWVKNQQNVVAQPNINAKQYGNELKIPVPSLDLQNQFAERVQAIEAQKAQAQASLAQADHLFNSLLQKAFKGKLV